MSRLFSIILGTMLCVALVLGGASSGYARDAASTKLRTSVSDYERTVREGAVLGAILGAGIGAAIGAKNGTRGVLNGAVVGGLIGGTLGTLGGKSVADSKARQISREDDLDAQIAHARTSNSKLASLVSISGDLVDRRRQQLSALSASKAGTRIQKKQALLGDLREDRKSIDQALRLARKARGSLQSNINNYRTASGLKAEASKTDEAITRLQSDRDQLDRMIKSAS